jgi:hypothetical protein
VNNLNINLSASNENNIVTLTWVNDFTGATTYDIYRRECENTVNGTSLPGVFTKIATVSDSKYLDTIKNIVPAEPTEPTISINIQVRRGERTINVKSTEGGTKYEYYVHGTSDIDPANEVDSNKAYAIAINGIKGYRYCLKKIETTTYAPPDSTEYTYSDTTAILLTNLVDGTYGFYAKAVDNLNIESKVSRDTFNIINEYFDEKRIIEEIPVGVRYNSRYRGPQESKKVDFMHQQIRYNLDKLKTKVTGLEKYVKYTPSTRNLYDYLKTNSHKITMRTCSYNVVPLKYPAGTIVLDNKVIHTQTRGIGFVAFDKHMNILRDVQYDTHATPAQMNNLAADIDTIPSESFIAIQAFDSMGSPMESDLIKQFNNLGLNGTQMSIDVPLVLNCPGRVTFQAIVYITRNPVTHAIESSRVINKYYDKDGFTASAISSNLGIWQDEIYGAITYDTTDLIEKPVTYYQDIAIKIEDIEEVLSDIREEIKYEQRNH